MLPWLLGFLVPTVFLIVGVVAKKLVNSEPKWQWDDLYLGIEITLAALTACVLNACDLYKSSMRVEADLDAATKQTLVAGDLESHKRQAQTYLQSLKDFREEQGRNTVILALSFVAFLFAGTVHQRWNEEPDGYTKRWMLAGLSNFCGYFPLVCYMLWVKGG